MNRPIAGIALGSVAIAMLAGCSSAEAPVAASPTPTLTENAAIQPCNDFSKLTDELATLVVNFWTENGESGDAERMQAMPDDFDMIALSAGGTVGDRIATVSELLHDTAPVVMSTKPDEYFDAIKAVQRACASEGVTIGVATWKSG